MATILHIEPIAAKSALARLGLNEEALLEAAKHGYLARSNCTANHPPLYAPFVAWGETVRVLREQLTTIGWKRNDEKNYSRIIHPDGYFAIAVATGDEATGMASGFPCNKSVKGPSTIDAIEINRLQAWLPGMGPDELQNDPKEGQPMTWLLLVHHALNEIRSELSQPFDIGSNGRINGWRERILLRTIPLDFDPQEIIPPSQPDLDVAVRRKA
ncbi:hypothetical protein [Candidatus Nitrotoga sp. AM1P]|uniref:hypothetical protein n=1 Tax=Candidatus Nitrotoga sp. AM1P TaxID=2559597 RepID=UPI001562F79A|nr:hypothetical protein [Candidatus Nitrotoga sp. AM1P]